MNHPMNHHPKASGRVSADNVQKIAPSPGGGGLRHPIAHEWCYIRQGHLIFWREICRSFLNKENMNFLQIPKFGESGDRQNHSTHAATLPDHRRWSAFAGAMVILRVWGGAIYFTPLRDRRGVKYTR